jgi:oxygen-independent coproporphyrinogen-3 oxidase
MYRVARGAPPRCATAVLPRCRGGERYIAGVPPRHVYVHVPFCARRCAYCDFSIAVRRVVPVDEYVDAIRRELALRFPREEGGWRAETLYFGGGTPSRLGGEGVRRLLDVVRERVALEPGAEVTLEANPEDVTPAALAAWRDAGIDRLSLGGQSFDDRVLAWMHRGHDARAVSRAVEMARDAGLGHVSFDLIFALPAELGRDWSRDLDLAVALAPSHLSLYGLTVESGTPLGRWRERGQVREASEEEYEREFLEAHARLAGAGFEHYEVSNFAGAGGRARHNSAYWRGVAYAGLGPSAHEFDGRRRRWNVGPYAEWVRRLGGGSDPLEGAETLTDENRVAETVYLGLRTIDGLQLACSGEQERIVRWVEAGWAVLDGDRVRLTASGWLRLDSLAADLTLLRSRC